ncbi:rod shape-determining protein MreC [Piscinibacter sp.]|uniref:rod shape-determining protein MreC n=1 Tax=Piscinibacter sp. TaxID=1903157 RepID=UPI002B7667EB|nr:rod shape-determining protein MreC [Albitalea sp.]HUG22972.1 rod shape-determining protein MreC [Albitalea sp.]
MAAPLGTLDRTPPPFFRQGPSALTKLTFCSALALFLMVADTRFKITQPVRTMVATILHPIERVLRVPVDAFNAVGDYAMGLQQALSNEAAARSALARQAERAARVEQLQRENEHLRALLDLRAALTVRSQPSEILYEAPDPFSRKVIIDRGSAQGIALASPVINEAGVLGQVTRVYPLSSEVTLLTDKDAAIPVLNTRTFSRSAAFGIATGSGLELRFLASNADVKVGDLLHTSGVDGVYPPGIAVATVTSVERKVDTGFAKVLLQPSAMPDGVRHVLVLEPIALQLPPRPDADASPPGLPTPAQASKGAPK